MSGVPAVKVDTRRFGSKKAKISGKLLFCRNWIHPCDAESVLLSDVIEFSTLFSYPS